MTPETLDDKLYESRTRTVVGVNCLIFFGIFKRIATAACLLYFFITNFNGYYYTNKFVSVDENSGRCEV